MTESTSARNCGTGEFAGIGGVTRTVPSLSDECHNSSDTQEAHAEGMFGRFELMRLPDLRKQDSHLLVDKNQIQTETTKCQVMRSLVKARQSMLTLQVGKGFACIVAAESALSTLPPGLKRVASTIDLLKAIGFALQDDILGALCFAQAAIKHVGEDSEARAATTICRFAYWRLGDLNRFFALPRSRSRLASGGTGTICDIFDLAIEAAVEFDQLRFSSARHLAQDALALAGSRFARRPFFAALPASLMAQLLYEQGSVREAEEMIQRHLPAIRECGAIASAVRAYPLLARIISHHGQHDLAIVILKETEVLAEQRGWCRLAAACLAERATLLLEDGQFADARICADHLEFLATVPGTVSGHAQSDIRRTWTFTQVRIALAQNPSRYVVDVLRQLEHEAVNRRDLYEALHVAICLVDALDVLGADSEALDVLIRTLTLGSAVGVYQSFLDRGPRFGSLLTRVYERARTSDDQSRQLLPYIGSLLDKWRERDTLNTSPPAKFVSNGILSERERITLIWMSRGLSNKGIAKKLGITPETVKSHVKSIFIKLTVKARTEAVSRGSDLGLI